MKFLCMKCESFMTFEKVQLPGEQSLGVTFGCPKCGNKVAMVTNPGETAMVQALGVKLGGRSTAPEPMELTRETLKEEPRMGRGGQAKQPAEASSSAPVAAAKDEPTSGGTCPFSSMVAQMQGTDRSKAEEVSKAAPVEPVWSLEAQERLNKIPSFMRPMVQMGIERYAKKQAIASITPEVMDASKNDAGEIEWTAEAVRRLDNIPSFIRPMAKKEIERIAREKGVAAVTETLMNEAKEKFMGMGY
ncbi:MAG TPA: PCP reductase family protein [Nitrospiria bacterium]|nr:PCP reductase family protein [Nitrospiria bacterium]